MKSRSAFSGLTQHNQEVIGMAGMKETLTAGTKKELEELARAWLSGPREQGWGIRQDWDPKRARKNEDGEWEIVVSAHT